MNIEELIAGLKAKGLNDEAIKEELNKIKADIDAYLNPSANHEEKNDEVKEEVDEDVDKRKAVFGV